MKLNTKNVTRGIAEYKAVKKLMKRAFPFNERIPVSQLNYLTKYDCVSFTAYYLNDELCGISYTVETERAVLLLYLAVFEEFRSRGCGSAILAELKKRYGKPILIDLEIPNEHAKNNEQRLRRVEFYKRNGFTMHNETVMLAGSIYAVMSTSKIDNVKDIYRSAFHFIRTNGRQCNKHM